MMQPLQQLLFLNILWATLQSPPLPSTVQVRLPSVITHRSSRNHQTYLCLTVFRQASSQILAVLSVWLSLQTLILLANIVSYLNHRSSSGVLMKRIFQKMSCQMKFNSLCKLTLAFQLFKSCKNLSQKQCTPWKAQTSSLASMNFNSFLPVDTHQPWPMTSQAHSAVFWLQMIMVIQVNSLWVRQVSMICLAVTQSGYAMRLNTSILGKRLAVQ